MVHIGVTGHRFLGEVNILNAAIDEVAARIGEKYPGEDWTVVSSLAEGADRLVVRRLLLWHPDLILIAPLPLPVEEYEKDFLEVESRKEFHELLARAGRILYAPEFSRREEAYRAAGIAMLDASDVLITLWNGEPARGTGGTGEIVELARQRGMPVAWVHCKNLNIPNSEATRDRAEHGKVVLERF